MKYAKWKLSVLGIAVAGLFAFNGFVTGGIKGTITPADGAVRAWAINATDTVRAEVSGSSFEIKDVKPGTYQVIIEAKAPYKNIAKDGVSVTDGQTADAGEFKLAQ